MLNDYTCPETGEVLVLKEPTEAINKIKSDMEKLQTNLVLISKEIEEIEKKDHKTIERKVKAEQKKKDLERKKKREERDKEKKKLAKKSPPKKTAKKKKSSKKASSKKKK